LKKRYVAIICVAGLLLYSGLVEPYWVIERSHELRVPGLGSRTLRIVHIADVHTTRYGRREAKTIRMIERINPDYVFLTGDLLKSGSRLQAGLDFLARLRARHGIYVVPGNADRQLTRAIDYGRISKDTLNYRILVNENVDCGPFTLVGIDDPVTCRENLSAAFRGVGHSKPLFVLTHFHPDTLLEHFRGMGVDLAFSGHTHGGQFGLTTAMGPVPYVSRSKYLSGLYHLDGLTLSVTQGVGVNIFPLRLMCRPEILVFDLTGE
jgi:hypothetical protein